MLVYYDGMDFLLAPCCYAKFFMKCKPDNSWTFHLVATWMTGGFCSYVLFILPEGMHIYIYTHVHDCAWHDLQTKYSVNYRDYY